ncbi:MAG: hypothetical protein H0W74_10895 [Sphingosinicella sp.]|nr:hypothetical protein [Sphingosinicella sp.]
MGFGKVSMAAIVALSMTSAPAFANATPGSSLSVSQARASASLEDEGQLGGGFIIPLLALAAIIAGILVVIDDGDDDPTSP